MASTLLYLRQHGSSYLVQTKRRLNMCKGNSQIKWPSLRSNRGIRPWRSWHSPRCLDSDSAQTNELAFISLDIPPSLVLITVEARMAALKLEAYQASQERLVNEFLRAGKLRSESGNGGTQGVRGKRAEDNRRLVQSLQSEGLTKAAIARKLGIGATTVDRHWRKANDDQ